MVPLLLVKEKWNTNLHNLYETNWNWWSGAEYTISGDPKFIMQVVVEAVLIMVMVSSTGTIMSGGCGGRSGGGGDWWQWRQRDLQGGENRWRRRWCEGCKQPYQALVQKWRRIRGGSGGSGVVIIAYPS